MQAYASAQAALPMQPRDVVSLRAQEPPPTDRTYEPDGALEIVATLLTHVPINRWLPRS